MKNSNTVSDHKDKCEYCDGMGRYYPFEYIGDCEALEIHYKTCRHCNGTGRIQSQTNNNSVKNEDNPYTIDNLPYRG